MERKRIEELIGSDLLSIIRDEYKGWDPYDCLNSPLIGGIKNRWLRIAFTQLMVYSPVNLREPLRIPKEINPKAMALMLSSLADMKRSGVAVADIDTEEEMRRISGWLLDNANRKFSGPSWGYNFPWQDLRKFIPANQPSVVVSSFVGHALLDMMEAGISEDVIDEAEGICRFITGDLNVYKDREGICFSYSPYDRNFVHNANLLGASLLARVHRITGDPDLLDWSRDAYALTLSRQREDGSWFYSFDPAAGRTREQLDFHQGYILDALTDHIRYIGGKPEVREALEKGARFYAGLFRDDSISYWRYPRKWPVDIHNQAQGVITFGGLSRFDKRYGEIKEKILRWTIDAFMIDRERFYTRRTPLWGNRIQYIRWNRAWVLRALSSSLREG